MSEEDPLLSKAGNVTGLIPRHVSDSNSAVDRILYACVIHTAERRILVEYGEPGRGSNVGMLVRGEIIPDLNASAAQDHVDCKLVEKLGIYIYTTFMDEGFAVIHVATSEFPLTRSLQFDDAVAQGFIQGDFGLEKSKDVEFPTYEGDLKKKGEHVLSAWKKRFFLLEHNILFYFAAKGGEQKGFINLVDVNTVDFSTTRPNYITLVHESGREFDLYGADAPEVAKWNENIAKSREAMAAENENDGLRSPSGFVQSLQGMVHQFNNSPPETASDKVKKKIESVKVQTTNNLEKAIRRYPIIQVTVDDTEHMREDAEAFHDRAGDVSDVTWWKLQQSRVVLIVTVIVLIAVIALVVFLAIPKE